MSILFKNRPWIFALLVAVFFLCARAGSIAHAANYGSAPHNHDGKICVLSVLSTEDDEQDDLALPPAEISLESAAVVFGVFTDISVSFVQENPINLTARSPPGK